MIDTVSSIVENLSINESTKLNEYAELKVGSKLKPLLIRAIRSSVANPDLLIRNIAIEINDSPFDEDPQLHKEVGAFYDSLSSALRSVQNGYF